MVKTTVYLDEDIAVALRAISERIGRPQAELIREAVRGYAGSQAPPLPAGMGKFRGKRQDVSENYRKLLRQAVREKRWR